MVDFLQIEEASPPPSEAKTDWTVMDCFAGRDRLRAFYHRSYQIGSHRHEFPELNLVTAGTGEHFIGAGKVALRPGDAFVIPPGVVHAYIDQGGLEVGHLLIHPAFLAENRERLAGMEGFHTLFSVEPYFQQQGVLRYGTRLDNAKFGTIRRQFDELAAECAAPSRPGSRWLAELLALELILRLCRAHAETFCDQSDVHASPRAVTAALDCIYRRRGIGVSLDGLAHLAHLEKSYFCRLFHRATGTTPLQAARREQLREARRRLTGTAVPIGQLALELGFCGAAHFTRAFRQENGRTPSDFRKHGA